MKNNICLGIALFSLLMMAGCSSTDDYYDNGYAAGYSEGYDEGYYDGEEKAFDYFTSSPSEYVDMDKYVADYIYDNGILTLEIIKDDISESDYQKIVDILDEYY